MYTAIIHNFNSLGMTEGDIQARSTHNSLADATAWLRRTTRANLLHPDTEVYRYEIYEGQYRLIAQGAWPLTAEPVNLREHIFSVCRKIHEQTRASGSFYGALGDAFQRADGGNFQRLALAFPELVRQAQEALAKEWAAALAE